MENQNKNRRGRPKNSTTLRNYGCGFSYKPYRALDKALNAAKRLSREDYNPLLPCYELFALSALWYEVSMGRWPHLGVSENAADNSCGVLLKDWNKTHLILGSWFDMGAFQFFVGLRIPVFKAGASRMAPQDTVYMGVFADDNQCIEDFLDAENIGVLQSFLNDFSFRNFRMDFQMDPFFVCEVPHTEGLHVFTRLLDHLERIYDADSSTFNLAGV